MVSYKTTDAEASKKLKDRLRKVLRRVRTAGMWYFFGCLAFIGFAILPLITIDGQSIDLLSYITLFQNEGFPSDLKLIIPFVLYCFIILTALINFIRLCCQLRYLLKWRYMQEHNNNTRALDVVGKIYSGTFGGFLNFYLLIVLLSEGVVELSWLAYVVLAFGMFIHFTAGILEAKVSVFVVNEKTANVKEEFRTGNVFIDFFRNLIQITEVLAILYFFIPESGIAGFVGGLLSGAMNIEIPAILDLVAMLCLFVLIKHATASTEYNFYVNNGKGMRNFRWFSFLLFALSAGKVAMGLMETGFDLTTLDTTQLYVPVIALLSVFVDWALQDKTWKGEMREASAIVHGELVKDEQEEEHEDNKQAPQYPPYPPMPGYPAAGAYPNSMYVPVYYPCVIQPENNKSVPPVEEMPVIPEPPQVVMDLANPEELTELDPNKEFKVRCPQCGKELSVKDKSPYHRCPTCGKVFTLQKFRTYQKA